MALLGRGVLAIWNGIAPTAEEEFIRWHVREHIPERVGLSGFLRGRRYIAHNGHPKYFNFYETETPQTLQSEEYRARLNTPTPWTQSVVKEFRDTSRTICEVAISEGHGEGACVDAIQFKGIANKATLISRFDQPVRQFLLQDGVVGAHLLVAIDSGPRVATAESRLRAQPDAVCEAIMLIEAVEIGFLERLHADVTNSETLCHTAGASSVERGIYRLQYSLTHTDLMQKYAQ
jgi:hypothetical protein